MISPDKIDKIGNSVVHHGKGSNRVYLMSLDPNDLPNITQSLYSLAEENNYTKIIVKTPVCYAEVFKANGYVLEAIIPKFYNGETDGCFISKYLDIKRKTDPFILEYKKILDIANQKKAELLRLSLGNDFICRQATEKDAPFMAEVYKKVFDSYPFPIFDESYILNTMKENVIYYGIWHNEKLIALSSIELYQEYSHAEMTDFAVLNNYRGSGFALYLLQIMEEKLSDLNIKTAFTIARAKSAGMNITFSKNGYSYAGTLINNTDISGQIESMNIWYKIIL